MIKIQENDVETLDVPGRKLKWLFHPEDQLSERFSLNVITIAPGETVRPAHAHPNEEEVIYVVSGEGRVFIEGEVSDLTAGTAVLFPKGHKHMVQNSGIEPLKLVCFFTPPVDFNQYQYFEDIDFPK